MLPKLLAQHVEDYEIENTMYNQDPHKGGTARRYLCSILKEHVNCYSIEVSMYGYNRRKDVSFDLYILLFSTSRLFFRVNNFLL